MKEILKWISEKGYDIDPNEHLAGTLKVELTFNELAQLLNEYENEHKQKTLLENAKYHDAADYEIVAGERIAEWIEGSLTFENGGKRKPTKEDGYIFGEVRINWILTQKGENLFDRYVARANKLGRKLFPDDEIDVSQHTGVIYP